ncbi:cyclic nucleotide-binding domain-containing protein [Salegentibacter flavus]|uniref:Cyclic nucleotide-binding domain-containing protein n=1 Tax=Salegentibacter flavus TaxID=287099 RepID=A0A1I5CXY7_9FLAO|nr:cyclic nucleotide-binding domain-containing protein [Salegentibacter flavus]SFN91822.1 hypothetical protein SAMN05660413_03068 [Salegentibacter flavus]
MTDEEFQFVLDYFEAKNYRKNQYVVQAGATAPLDHFVTSGLLKSYFIDEDSKEKYPSIRYGGLVDFRSSGYHNRSPSALNIDCIEDTTALAITIGNR